MAARVTEFDGARLARDARCAGEAFGFDDVEGEMPPSPYAPALVWWMAGGAALAGALVYSFL